MLEIIGGWIINLISFFGYWSIFFLMLLESACIPIPSEITMPFAGSLVSLGRLNFWLVVITGTLGNLAGSLAAYFLGVWGQETVVRRVIVKYGKYFLLSEHEYDRSEAWFRKHGEIIVFLSRILPVVRTFISLPAGVARMNLTRFTVYTMLGSFIWSYFLTYIGIVLGNNWSGLQVYFHRFDVLIVIAAALGIIIYIKRKLKHLSKKSS